ncbi:MAG: ABC transporter substrate-binding protein [Deltaproteobacteria bacterium]|nr:MAG: ABC transporter substrate-binding protein [Deltaproteobacteria bacterium]
MKNNWIHSKRRIIVAAVILSLAFGLSAPATAQLRKINIAYTATSPYQAALIIAKESGIFKKHGLDPQLILTPGGSLGFQAMMGGDVAMVMADGSAAVTSNLAGADVVIIASFLNTFPYSLISIPEVKKVDQLIGGKVAISRFGSATDVSVRMSLAKVGLNPDKDVTILQIGTQTTRFAALQSKQVQATIITPPFTLTARKQGYNTLIDMGQLNIPFELTALLTRRSYIKAQRETVTDVVTALSEAVHYYKREKEPVLKILSRYLQTNDREALEETYREIALKTIQRRARAEESESQSFTSRRLRRYEFREKTGRRRLFFAVVQKVDSDLPSPEDNNRHG